MSIINRNKREFEYTEKNIQKILNMYYLTRSSCKYITNNLYILGHESDYLAITRSGLIHEIEIKISRNDYKNDFKNKKEKHLLLESKETNSIKKPDYFYYAVPNKMIDVNEVPEYAGLIYIIDVFPYVVIAKKAPRLKKEKTDISLLNLEEKFYYNMQNWKYKCEVTYGEEIQDLREHLKLAKLDENGNKYKFDIYEAHKEIDRLNLIIQEQNKKIELLETDNLDYKKELRLYQKQLNNITIKK